MKKSSVIIAFLLLMMTLFAGLAQATPVTYAAELHTSKLNPVTNVLILEQDQSGTVHGTVYGANVPGNGQAVISHNPVFVPVRSLIIGITAGLDPNGADKTEIIMFLNKTFAASIKGVKWSNVFPGSSHSGTIDRLIAATEGNAAELTWFTDTFFTGIAAPAIFDTGTAFIVGEFSSFDTIGSAVTAGNWLLNSPIVLLAKDAPGTIVGLPTAVINETATTTGPFDVEFHFGSFGTFGVEKTVVNGTNRVWREFTLKVGTGMGGAFVPSVIPTQDSNEPNFNSSSNVTEVTGAFPNVSWSSDTIVFRGRLNPGETAVFKFTAASTSETLNNTVTIRQGVVAEPLAIPSLNTWAIIILALFLAGLAIFRIRCAHWDA